MFKLESEELFSVQFCGFSEPELTEKETERSETAARAWTVSGCKGVGGGKRKGGPEYSGARVRVRWRAEDPSLPYLKQTVSDAFLLSPSFLPRIPRIIQQHTPTQTNQGL